MAVSLLMAEMQWDEWDGEVIEGVRFMNTFTANLARNSRTIGAEQERKRLIRIMEKESGHYFVDPQCRCKYCDLFYLINDVNIL